MQPTADDVRALARSAPQRWASLHLLHRTPHEEEVEAWLRHGDLRARRRGGSRIRRERGAPPSSWTVRPLEPILETYRWAAMLDPYELGEHVEVSEVRADRLFGRRVWRFRARAEEGYDPICACCPLVLSEVSQRLELGDDWTPSPDAPLPESCAIALDVATGIVVSSRDEGGARGDWFENEILAAT